MQRLLKRRKVQECLEETEKEMGDTGMSLNDLESLLNEEGIDTKIETLPTRRIASNVTSRFLLIKDVKQAIADAKKKQVKQENKPGTSNVVITEINETEDKPKVVDELEDDLQKAIQMSLECVDEPNTSNASKADDSWTSCMTDSGSEYSYSGTDSEEGDGFEEPDISCAKSYIMQYSDFTHRVIDELVSDRRKVKNKQKLPKVDEIIEEINKEKSVIVDNVELSSSDDEYTYNKNTDSLSSERNNDRNVDSNIISNDCEKLDESLDATQASVVCIENPAPDIISLDTSTEDTESQKDTEPQKVEVKKELDLSDHELEEVESVQTKDGSDSSDSDFEEVPDEETKITKPVVELTLNMGDAPDDDDIFADVFTENNVKQSIEINHDEQKTKIEPTSIKIEGEFKIPQIPANKTSIKNSSKPFINVSNNSITDIKNKNEATNIPEIAKDLPDDIKEISKPVHNDKVTNIKEANDQASSTTTGNRLALESINAANKESAKNAPKEIVSEPSLDPSKEVSTVLPKEVFSTEQLNTMVEEMQNQEQNLMQEKGRLDRVGRNITDQMTKEAQELLQIFGIPYIVAPMEAEAQCAFLESAKLTDGTITDDSDIWLFGGRTVYKNFFNQKKHVLQFQAERIETSFSKYKCLGYNFSIFSLIL